MVQVSPEQWQRAVSKEEEERTKKIICDLFEYIQVCTRYEKEHTKETMMLNGTFCCLVNIIKYFIHKDEQKNVVSGLISHMKEKFNLESIDV